MKIKQLKQSIFAIALLCTTLLQMPCFAANTIDAEDFYQDTFGWTKLHQAIVLWDDHEDNFWESPEEREQESITKLNKLLPFAQPRMVVNEPDKAGRTPLHLAIICGNQTAIKILKDTGKADQNALDFFGLTPDDYAQKANKIAPSEKQNYSELLKLFAPFVFISKVLAEEFLDADNFQGNKLNFDNGKNIVSSFKNKNVEEQKQTIIDFVEEQLKAKEKIDFTKHGLTTENIYSFLATPVLLKTDKREQIIHLLNQAAPFTSYKKTANIAHMLELIKIDTEYKNVFDSYQNCGPKNKHLLKALVFLHNSYDTIIDPQKNKAYDYLSLNAKQIEFERIVNKRSREKIDNYINRNLAFLLPWNLHRIVLREAYFNTKSIDRSYKYAKKAGFEDLLLPDACQYCDLDDIKKCVEIYKCPVNQKYTLQTYNLPCVHMASPSCVYMASPLHAAAKRGKADIVEYLISKGARTDIFDARIEMPYDVINEQNEDNHPATTKKLQTLLKPSYWSRVSQLIRCHSSRDFVIGLFTTTDTLSLMLSSGVRYGTIALIGACIQKLQGTSNIKSFRLSLGSWSLAEALLSLFTTALTYKYGPIDKDWNGFVFKASAFETPSPQYYYPLLGGRIETIGALAACAANLPTKYAAFLWPVVALEALKLWYMTPCVDWDYKTWKQKLFGSKTRTALTLGAGTLVTAAATALLAQRSPIEDCKVFTSIYRISKVATLASSVANLPKKYAALLLPITAFEALKLWYMTPFVDWSYQDWKQKLFGSKIRTALTLGAGTLVTAAATALLAQRSPAVLAALQSTGKFMSTALPKLWGNGHCRSYGFDTIAYGNHSP